MKNLIAIAFILFVFTSCEDDIGDPCNQYATVVDMTGFDGCGFVLITPSGEKYEPVWRWGWCATPPMPEDYENDPLVDFELQDGQKVRFSFELSNTYSICMVGTPVIVTCIEEIEPAQTQEE